ncbi:TRASH domain-containing protein [Plasmodiophora brassicae]|uniref:TRASH domain-containing protein n=1 Tax=Plasmodiophora brassicae TaxID=37360 RepID=A0A0G4IQE3_PLABS|nr:hypothetical protein PBRA_000923 [Plasmodiophora brassicae]SPQ97880.1 unnamed protein product [Plasmodiophora brassicae]
MRLEKCYFCSSTVYPGHGVTFVRNDCKVFNFCRSKCHKNFKMKRNPRHVRWTKAFRKSHGKELAVDATFDFERKRNIPTKYDRNLMAATLKAMKKVEDIKTLRKERFYKARMKPAKIIQKKQALATIKQGIDLIKSPLVRESVMLVTEDAVKSKETTNKTDAMVED